MSKIRIGIIGIGFIATQKHIPDLVKRTDIEIVALCDTDTVKCVRANSEFGLIAKVYTDYKELCQSPDVDAVYVCTPAQFHHSMTMEALKYGKRVYCESSIICTYAETREILSHV